MIETDRVFFVVGVEAEETVEDRSILLEHDGL
jgi:hypothetical protein